MSVIGNPLLLGGDAGTPSYTIDRSVRLRSSATAYFTRTPASAGNRKTFTYSGWVKRGALGVNVSIFGAQANGSQGTQRFNLFWQASTDTLCFNDEQINLSTNFALVTTQTFRDPAAWYHIVVAVDTTQAVASNRLKLYINGIQVTAFSTAVYPSLNFDSVVNSAVPHYLGYYNNLGTTIFYGDGYRTEENLIDGQALTPSAFGEYDAVRNTQWKPKAYSGSWGTNGFYLKFANPASIGLDSSGNGNNWTANNIQTSNSALTTYDSMLDVPTLTSATNANFPVLNVVAGLGNGTYSDGNLAYLNGVAATWKSGVGSMGVTSGKYYFEYTIAAVSNSSNFYLGVAGSTYNGFASYLGRTSDSWAFQWNGASSVKTNNDVSTTVSTAGSISVNNVIQVAIDLGTGSIWWGRNNTWVQGDPSAGTGASFTNLTGTILPAVAVYSNGGDKIAANFGQRPFTYTPPSGFKSLNTYNLPDPTIASGDDFHKVYTYTGNGGGLQVGEIQKPMSLYNLDRSLRFKGTNSYFDKVFASGGANTKGTISMWVKRSKLGVQQELFRFGTTGTLFSGLLFNASDQLAFLRLNSTYQVNLVTTRVFKDPSLWYHIVVAWDTTLATASDRVKIYVNGIQETVFTSATYPTQNLDMYFFTAGTHNIGRYPVGGNYFGGYMAEFHAVDGQQLTASSFGQFDGNYYWTPKDYTGGYGTNGWHLDFEDYSSMSATGIGKDVSGLGNNFTPYNFNVTVPANTNTDWDSMVDVPTLTSADVANFATFSPLNNATTLSNGSLTSSAATNTGVCATLDIPSAGSFYWEVTATTVVAGGNTLVGMIAINQATTVRDGTVAGVRLVARSDGLIIIDSTTVQSGLGAWSSGDVIGCAYNAATNSFQFYRNNSTFGTAVTPTSGYTFVPWCCSVVSGTSVFNVNFGQRPFRYTPPTGFKSLNSFNVAEVTGDLESPDFVWIKSRSATTNHALFNSVTGVGKYLSSNATTAETTDVNSLIQFNKNGFLLGNSAVANTLSATYVASAWKVGGSIVTNTDGTIASQVRANPTAGISVVTYTGSNTASQTVGHGLDATPKMVIIKGRGNVFGWSVQHYGLTGGNNYLALNTTAAQAVDNTQGAISNATNLVFQVSGTGGASSWTNAATTYVAHCFAEVAGFSKFGSYVGNGSTSVPSDGPFVYTGFRPRWIMIKCSTSDHSGNAVWNIFDTTRSTHNVALNRIFANLTSIEGATIGIDILSNGFKLRESSTAFNASGSTYIYAAFAEHPFKYSLAR